MKTLTLLPALLLLVVLGCKPQDPAGDPTDTHDTDEPDRTEPHGTDALQFQGPVPRNLLFISIDTFRKDHLGAHGDLGLTPFLDQIASTGVVLDDHMQCSNWTFGSTTCTLAGRSNIERGHLPRLNGTEETRLPVPQGTPFLATWLAEAGFYNILVSANGWLGPQWGNSQGYHEVLKPGGGALAVYNTGTGALHLARKTGLADRWFLHLHFMEPHAAYNPPDKHLEGIEDLPPYPVDLRNRGMHYEQRDTYATLNPEDQELLEAHLRLLYAGEIRTIDARLADIWSRLQNNGLLDDTLVVIWNDHGEQFWEHGAQTHAYDLYGEENDGFAIFWARNIVPGRYTGPTAAIDIVPTVLDLFDLPMPEEVTGYPVGAAPEGRPRFAEALARRGGVQAVVVDGYKLHYRWGGQVRFFDRNTDPDEQHDLYDPQDPRVLELWGHLKPMVEAMAPLVIGNGPQPSWPPELP